MWNFQHERFERYNAKTLILRVLIKNERNEMNFRFSKHLDESEIMKKVVTAEIIIFKNRTMRKSWPQCIVLLLTQLKTMLQNSDHTSGRTHEFIF